MIKKLIFMGVIFVTLTTFVGVSMGIEQIQSSNDVASTERTNIAVQTVTAANAVHLINLRFNPVFNLTTFPGSGGKISAVLPEGFVSLSAGEQSAGVSLWASTSYNKIEDDFALTAYDGTSITTAVGGDFQLSPNVILGLSLNYANTDIDTDFNQGNSQTDGFTLMPYANLKFNDWLSMDMSVGYAWNTTDIRRIQTSTAVTGEQDSEGWVMAGNLNAQKWFDKVFVSAKTGLLYNQDKRSTFTENNGTVNLGRTNELVQASIGGSVGYWMAPCMPSLSVTYTYDIDREDQVIAGGGPQPANDNDGLTVGLGLSFYGSGTTQGLSVTVSATSEFLREDLTNNGISLNARYAF